MDNKRGDLVVMGKRIKRLRLARGLRVEQLAAKAGLSAAQIYRLQNDERPNVSALVLAHIAGALDTTLEYLVGLTNDERCIHNLITSAPEKSPKEFKSSEENMRSELS